MKSAFLTLTCAAALALGVGCGNGTAANNRSSAVRETERANQKNPNVVNGPKADRENRAGQAMNGDARSTPNTAPPPVTPGDRRGSRGSR